MSLHLLSLIIFWNILTVYLFELENEQQFPLLKSDQLLQKTQNRLQTFEFYNLCKFQSLLVYSILHEQTLTVV